MALTRTLLIGVLVLPACGSHDGPPAPPDSCPHAWTSGTSVARGSLAVAAADATIDGEWTVGIEATTDVVTVRACVIKMVERENPPAGEDPWFPWEERTFTGTWRFAEPISERTQIAGATLAGAPGMSGGMARIEIVCDGPTCRNEVAESWLFMQSAASELFVDRWDPFSRALHSSGWVLADDTGTRVDIDLEASW